MACAIVLQAWLGWPLALRMAGEGAAEIGETVLPCVETGSKHPMPGHGDVSRGEPDGSPAPGHKHQTCLVCQGSLGQLLLLAVWPPAVPGSAEAPHDGAWPDGLAAQPDVAAHAPRAPPMNA